MNRRTYLSRLATVGALGSAGCMGGSGGSDDVDGPTIDAAEYLSSAESLRTDWLYAPPSEEEAYDFGFADPNAVLAMDHRFADIGALLHLAGSRHLNFWRSIDSEEINQLTFVDRREPDGEYEAGAFVAEGTIEADSVIEEAPQFFAEQELLEERTFAGAEILEFGSGDLIAVGEDFVVFSIEPFRRGRERVELVERVLESHRGDRERYLEADADVRDALSRFDEAHLFEAGSGPRLADGPDDALATGESLRILGGFAEIILVAVFENDADAEHATQFDASFEAIAEEALTAETTVRGRATITRQRVDTDVIRGGDDGGGGVPEPGSGVPGP